VTTPAPTADDRAIRERVSRWYEALGAGDAAALGPLLADDAVAMVPGRPSLIGKPRVLEAMRRYLESFSPRPRVRVREVRVSGDLGFARLAEETDVAPAGGGDPFHLSQRAIVIVFRLAGGEWRIGRLIANLDHRGAER
jgi:uncharacterized protein (TIGR02246 family)